MNEEMKRYKISSFNNEFKCCDNSCPYNTNGYCTSEVMQNSGICYQEYFEEMAKQGA